MAGIKFKYRVAGLIILLVVGMAALITWSIKESGGLKLPVGSGKPEISLGERHGLILASDGSLWAWGSDCLGWPVLGPGLPKSTKLRRIGHETNWTGISAAASHNLALKADGTLWKWGKNFVTRGTGVTPISIPVSAAPGNDWVQAAAGNDHSVALKKDGTLWSWGNNWTGQLGIGATKSSTVPVQIGSETNWTKVWAGILETVALRSDGTLWYWGENPNPAIAQGAQQIFLPKCVSADTNWVDVGFGVNTVFAIKADGTLWVWGRQAHVYTGATNQVQDGIPTRLGTNSDWQSISRSAGWWCQGLIKKDGSLWFMDLSAGKPNGPTAPFPSVKFRRIEFSKTYAAYAAGATHAAAPGVHGHIGVILTPEGEVWTWGMVLGDPPTLAHRFKSFFARIAQSFNKKISLPDVDPVYREKMWQLRHEE